MNNKFFKSGRAPEFSRHVFYNELPPLLNRFERDAADDPTSSVFFFARWRTSIPPHMYSLQNRRFCFRAVATSEHSVAVSDRISNQKHDPEVDPVVLCYFAMRDPALPVVRWLSDVIII